KREQCASAHVGGRHCGSASTAPFAPAPLGFTVRCKEFSPMPEQQEPLNSLPYRPLSLAELENAGRGSSTGLPYLLAVKFNYDVKQGGFSQLLYNMQGHFLAEIEDMLIAANAAVAHDYYIRAVTCCLENKEEYFRFLSSNYTDPNDLKHS